MFFSIHIAPDLWIWADWMCMYSSEILFISPLPQNTVLSLSCSIWFSVQLLFLPFKIPGAQWMKQQWHQKITSMSHNNESVLNLPPTELYFSTLLVLSPQISNSQHVSIPLPMRLLASISVLSYYLLYVAFSFNGWYRV